MSDTAIRPDQIQEQVIAESREQVPMRYPVGSTEGHPGALMPGYTANPAGRPKKGHSFGEKMRAKLEKMRAGSDATNADALIDHALKQALSEEPHAVRWAEIILDRTDGKVTQPIAVANVTLVLGADEDVP